MTRQKNYHDGSIMYFCLFRKPTMNESDRSIHFTGYNSKLVTVPLRAENISFLLIPKNKQLFSIFLRTIFREFLFFSA